MIVNKIFDPSLNEQSPSHSVEKYSCRIFQQRKQEAKICGRNRVFLYPRKKSKNSASSARRCRTSCSAKPGGSDEPRSTVDRSGSSRSAREATGLRSGTGISLHPSLGSDSVGGRDYSECRGMLNGAFHPCRSFAIAPENFFSLPQARCRDDETATG